MATPAIEGHESVTIGHDFVPLVLYQSAEGLTLGRLEAGDRQPGACAPRAKAADAAARRLREQKISLDRSRSREIGIIRGAWDMPLECQQS
jgi:hypothetical protein